jgi:hypothetical protein
MGGQTFECQTSICNVDLKVKCNLFFRYQHISSFYHDVNSYDIRNYTYDDVVAYESPATYSNESNKYLVVLPDPTDTDNAPEQTDQYEKVD